VQFYNVTGKKHFEAAKPAEGTLANYTAVPFVYERMDRVLGAADVVISRASATFLQELAGLEKAVIAVPARQLGDQLKNAAVYKAANAVVVLTDAELATDRRLSDELRSLIADPNVRESMAALLHAFAKPTAANDVADMIIDAVK
ncbi:MAG: glycosyltransferase, partial [Candidatus Saccharimonadales bacterium]